MQLCISTRPVGALGPRGSAAVFLVSRPLAETSFQDVAYRARVGLEGGEDRADLASDHGASLAPHIGSTPTSYGNFQMLPKPIAKPMVAQTKPARVCHRSDVIDSARWLARR